MKKLNRFYTYAYLREDRTPYYIGKGKDNRVYRKGRGEVYPPKDKTRIIFLKQNLTEEEAFKHEKYMIAVFGRKDLGTGILRNKTDGGEGLSGTIRSEETREKLRIAHTGKILSAEHRQKIKENNLGRKHSEETKRKQSNAHKGENSILYGKPLSEEHRKKISESLKGKMAKENHPLYGKSHSEKTKRKQSESNTGKYWWNDENGNNKFSKKCPGEGWVLGRGKKNKIKIGKNHHKSNYWKITFADGKIITQCGLSNWSKENGYDQSSIYRIYIGKYKRHKDIVAVEKLEQGHLNLVS